MGGGEFFLKNSPGCRYYCEEEDISIEGFLTLTKYDLPNRIFSGTFEFTLAMPECDTLRVTEGRSGSGSCFFVH